MKIICANWKFNQKLRKEKEALNFLLNLEKKLKKIKNVEVKIFAHFSVMKALSKKSKKVKIGAQDLHWEEDGAFTGATISARELFSMGIKEVLVGHSETRFYFGVDNKKVALKFQRAIENGLSPMVCIGETLEEKEEGKTEEVLRKQIEEGILSVLKELHFPKNSFSIAYEPIYAISGFAKMEGKTPRPAELKDIEFAHKFIKEIFLQENYPVKVLYGGSCNPENASEFLSKDFIDGLLVGSASFDFDSFFNIIKLTSQF